MRSFAGFTAALTLFILGCGSKEDVAEQPSETPVAESQATSETSTNQTETAPTGEIDESHPLYEEAKLIADLGNLIYQATVWDERGNYEKSLEAWDQVLTAVIEEYGVDAWEVTNVQLARSITQQRSEWTLEQRVQSVKISELENKGDLAVQHGEFNTALSHYEEAISLCTELWGANSHVTLNVQSKFGDVQYRSQQFDSAIATLSKVAAQREVVLGKEHPDTLANYDQLAELHQHLGQTAQAIKISATALEIAEALHGPRSVEAAKQRNNLGVAFYDAEDYERAIKHIETACEIREEKLGSTAPEVGHSYFNIAQAKVSGGRSVQAIQDFERAADVFSANPTLVAMQAQAIVQIGTIHMMNQDFSAAETRFRQARVVMEPARERQPALFAGICFKLGVALGKQGNYPSAEIQLREALDLQRQSLPQNDPQLAQTEQIYQLVQSKLGDVRTGRQPSSTQGTLQR